MRHRQGPWKERKCEELLKHKQSGKKQDSTLQVFSFAQIKKKKSITRCLEHIAPQGWTLFKVDMLFKGAPGPLPYSYVL